MIKNILDVSKSKLIFLFILSCAIFLIGDFALLQENPDMDVGEIIHHIKPERVTIDMIESALPRQEKEIDLFKTLSLRFLGNNFDRENSLKRYLVVGAYLSAAQWDWELFKKKYLYEKKTDNPKVDDLIVQINVAMQEYLIKINHRLQLLKAPKKVLVEIDSMNNYFAASKNEKLLQNFSKIHQLFELISKEIRFIALSNKNSEISFNLGKWLVYETRIAYLCINGDKSDNDYYLSKMNEMFNGINFTDFIKISQEIFGKEIKTLADDSKTSFNRLRSMFFVKNLKDVRLIQSQLNNIFELFEIRFPNLQG